jgi:uncharacterized membrane protein
MKNETTWKKSQRFGGISFIVGGVIIIIVCFLTKGFSCFWWTMGIVAILLIIDTYYTVNGRIRVPFYSLQVMP